MNVELPDGTILEDVPEGTTREQLRTKLKASGYDVSKLGPEEATPTRTALPKSAAPAAEKPGLIERHPLTRSLRAYGKFAGDTIVGLGKGTQDLVNASGLNQQFAPEGSELAAAPTDAPAERTAALDQMYQEAGPGASIGKVTTELAATGGPAGKAAQAAMGVVKGSGVLSKALRAAAGAGTAGGVGGALVAPREGETRADNAKQGAALGLVLAPVPALTRTLGRGVKDLVAPFTASGQDSIVGNAMRRFATNPDAARAGLGSASEVIPGSAPTAVTASGDEGLAALSRAMQNASPEYAANLSARQTAQNQARTAALEDIAGNTGKLNLAKKARDQLTSPMREQVLREAGSVQSDDLLRQIDRQIANPENAGKLAQQALNEFRGRIAQFSQDGAIDARALYAIRKDINDVLGGKLQGEAGNIRYASGQLTGVKGLIDDALDQASRRVPTSTGTGLSTAVRQGEVGPLTGGVTAQSAKPTWRGYLETYAKESIPIRQMEKLEEVMKAVQTGTVDSQGGLVLSAAKLNNLLKNQSSELIEELSPKQLDVLRRVQADLNATQLANNAGRAVGSNTVQNLSQNQLLTGVLGSRLGGSTPITSTLGRALQIPYGTANQQIRERLGQALLDPKIAARLLSQKKGDPAAEAEMLARILRNSGAAAGTAANDF